MRLGKANHVTSLGTGSGRQRSSLLDSVFEAYPTGVSISRLQDGCFIEINSAFTRAFGYRREEVRGKTAAELGLWLDPQQFTALMQALQAQGSVQDFATRLRTRNGEVRDFTLCARLLACNGDGLFMLIFFDVTDKRAEEEELARLAFYDGLTSLPNRRLLMERVNQAQITSARTRRYGALLFLDLDNFKQLNDTQGHLAGDLLLASMGQRLQACVREQDTVARLGGDEFVVLLEDLSGSPDSAQAEAQAVASKILLHLNRPYRLQNMDYSSSPSIGVTLFCGKDEAAHEIFKRADSAMYQAKSAGKNTYRFVNTPLPELVPPD